METFIAVLVVAIIFFALRSVIAARIEEQLRQEYEIKLDERFNEGKKEGYFEANKQIEEKFFSDRKPAEFKANFIRRIR